MAASRALSSTRIIVGFNSIRPNPVAIHLFLALVLASAAFVPAGFAQTHPRSYFESKLAVSRELPFSSGVLVGDTLYIAGTTAVSPENLKTAIGAEDEARLVMENVRQVLQQAGMTMDDLVSVQVFCTDLRNYDTFN
jgi:enamine deaminase RidA (YjgF/YER057c/UK114 family)